MVDVVTVPNLSEHLSSAATTQQLSARFSYAAAMKSLNNLLLLGDGETWSRQKIDFSGLPEMVRTFLQVAAGAADIPVTRLLGQSPSGMSATGESDTRNYYDMVSARQELDLRPQLERLDALLLRSAGVDPSALSFEFRPLWQMDAAQAATIALQKAQASQIYAGLNLWPAAVTTKLVESQLAEDGVYPGAEAIFAEAQAASHDPRPDTSTAASADQSLIDAFPASPGSLAYLTEPREANGRWTRGGGGGAPAGKGAAGEASEGSEPPDGAPRGHAPDGTPIEAAGYRSGRRKGLARALGALMGAIGRLIERWRSEEPDDSAPPPSVRKAAPSSSSNSSADPKVGRPAKFTPAETAGLRELFKGGGENKSVAGAQNLLDQLSKGHVDLPSGVTRDVLERYAELAQNAINDGTDKLAVQALRLKAIRQLLGQ